MDVGLKVFYANSDGETVEIPQYYRQAEKRLNRLTPRRRLGGGRDSLWRMLDTSCQIRETL
ncbi:MAG: hypothetical protein IM550_05240 [Microcystis sp. M54BS1]|nr:hypothetical protein [Microcystis aeruginosa PMC 728.11]MCA2505894.1 hypothetical protein [Microcystis sp. M62BS1]MCA2513601.1 hypothetical protein [Microcystis sp. M60BS1]MCA2516243.1 hypothetical protein [Microcystis sp. M59BS1]MCA2525564.1 hypothetical protein [Microcystis sp. M61BS1]MCA2531342.1 hypothetical protein [Microcystis sp. M51BS1]MCA2532884.1 hypothetical protein [Microcystis sp. M57BS1]MCA2538655.1 hypothetical protein [Microcystis sp. M54BS1]MCA2544743.1 hypothetical prot